MTISSQLHQNQRQIINTMILLGTMSTILQLHQNQRRHYHLVYYHVIAFPVITQINTIQTQSYEHWLLFMHLHCDRSYMYFRFTMSGN